MIRFIALGKQIGIDEEWPNEFAFFNTVSNRFIEVHESSTWKSWNDFSEGIDKSELDRFKNICPEWVFNVEPRFNGHKVSIEILRKVEAAAKEILIRTQGLIENVYASDYEYVTHACIRTAVRNLEILKGEFQL